MVHKLTGYYGNRPDYTPKKTDQLAIEISSFQVVCLVKNTLTAEMDALELFQMDKTHSDWSDIFFEIKQQSNILGQTYASTNIYYNFEEALILPLSKMSVSSAEDYLSLVYGEDQRTDTKFDKIDLTQPTVTIYRIKKSLSELLNRNFLLFTSQHSYTNILNDVFSREGLPPVFVKLIVYSKHIVIVLLKDGELQLIQSYQFQSPDDILYYCVSAVEQSGSTPVQAHLEISGLIDLQEGLLNQLKKSFGIISFDTIPDGAFANSGPADYSTYFLTPFYKLMA